MRKILFVIGKLSEEDVDWLVQIVGLGKDKPLNDQKTRDDRSRNRRVEVTLFSADQSRQAQAAQAQSPPSQQ